MTLALLAYGAVGLALGVGLLYGTRDLPATAEEQMGVCIIAILAWPVILLLTVLLMTSALVVGHVDARRWRRRRS